MEAVNGDFIDSIVNGDFNELPEPAEPRQESSSESDESDEDDNEEEVSIMTHREGSLMLKEPTLRMIPEKNVLDMVCEQRQRQQKRERLYLLTMP